MVLRLREVRQNTSGKVMLSAVQVLIYSEKENEVYLHEAGVSIMLSWKASDIHIEQELMPGRIIAARLDSSHQKITITQCFSLISDATVEGKTSFFQGSTKPGRLSV